MGSVGESLGEGVPESGGNTGEGSRIRTISDMRIHIKERTIEQGCPFIRHIDLLHWPIPVLCILMQAVCFPSKHS